MGALTSRDGTRVGFTRAGAGKPLILVDGALSYRKMGVNRALAELLAEHFTVFTYDRRGRGMPTLVVAGGKSPTWMQNAMKALAEALPNARHRTMEGQTHIVRARGLAPVLAEFFASRFDTGVQKGGLR